MGIRIQELEDELHVLKNNKSNTQPKSINIKPLPKAKALVLECLKNDSQVRYYTGIPNRKTFNLIYEYVLPKVRNMPYWRGHKNTVINKVRRYRGSPKKPGGKRSLVIKEEFLLALMQLRLGLLNRHLADMFGISESSVSNIFTTWVKVLAKLLKFLIYWPDKISVRNNLPKQFQKLYPRTRVIIDCTEFFIDTPRDLQLQAQVFSDYKHHTTAKSLIGITPRGSISFVSKCYGGRTSDKYITLNSGIMHYADPTDQWMADRGFLVRVELLEKGVDLVVPPGAKGHEQMLPTNVKKTKDIANLRIHVEKAIQRMKCFRLLKNQIPLTLLPLLDDMLIIVASLCNLQGPLVK